MKYKELIQSLAALNDQLKEQSLRAVNTALTFRNWFFGFYIVEFEQKGHDRAKYGKSLLKNIAKELNTLHISGISERELRRFRQFYSTYPFVSDFFKNDSAIRGIASPEFIRENILMQIRGLLPPEFIGKNTLIQIRDLPNPEFKIPETHYKRLFQDISYTHFAELIRLDDPLKRLFYEMETLKNTWSVSELKRQIGSLLYERTGLSKNKTKLLASLHDKIGEPDSQDIIRDPYIFEFLGLKAQEVFREKDLEQALLDHLLKFLLELGKGFCFEARQKRILIDNRHYFVDLVFYHRLLHCNVLIDLKSERFNYTHAGQMNMYLEYFKKYEMLPKDNPPVGILLCTDKNEEHVEFATAGMDDKVFVSKYLVALPGKKELEQFIKKELKKL